MDPIKILLVDDSKSARYALRLHLQHHGVQVDTADSAEAALERIAETQPQAVLMDHTMPGMNGFEALDILKSDVGTAHIPVVMCTSHDDPAYAAQALKRGALTVLSKADAAEKLPQVLDRIRGALAAQAELAEVTPSPVPEAAQAPTAIAAPAPAPTRAEIETWIEAHLSRRLAEAMEPQLARLTTQLRKVIVEQVEMAVDAFAPPAPAPAPPPVAAPAPIPAPAPTPVPQAPAIDLDQLREEIIPAAVRRHFDVERDGFLQLVQQCVQEASAPHEEDPDALRKILETVDATLTTRGTQIARNEAENAVQAALARDRDTLATLQQKLRNSYALGAAALVLAIGAAAAAFLI
jgi:CheY-like chemotaxis protein